MSAISPIESNPSNSKESAADKKAKILAWLIELANDKEIDDDFVSQVNDQLQKALSDRKEQEQALKRVKEELVEHLSMAQGSVLEGGTDMDVTAITSRLTSEAFSEGAPRRLVEDQAISYIELCVGLLKRRCEDFKEKKQGHIAGLRELVVFYESFASLDKRRRLIISKKRGAEEKQDESMESIETQIQELKIKHSSVIQAFPLITEQKLSNWMEYLENCLKQAMSEKGIFTPKWVETTIEILEGTLAMVRSHMQQLESDMTKAQDANEAFGIQQFERGCQKGLKEGFDIGSRAATRASSVVVSRRGSGMTSRAGLPPALPRAASDEPTKLQRDRKELKNSLEKFFSSAVLPIINELAFFYGAPVDNLPFTRQSITAPGASLFQAPLLPMEALQNPQEKALLLEVLATIIQEDGADQESEVLQTCIDRLSPKAGNTPVFQEMHTRLLGLQKLSAAAAASRPKVGGYLSTQALGKLSVDRSQDLEVLEAYYNKSRILWNLISEKSSALRYLPVYEEGSSLMGFIKGNLKQFKSHPFEKYRKDQAAAAQKPTKPKRL